MAGESRSLAHGATPAFSMSTSAGTPSGSRWSTQERTWSAMSAGDWSATSRKLIFACASAGMIVLWPGPWEPPHMPLTPAVGRRPEPFQGAEAGLSVRGGAGRRPGQPLGLVERHAAHQLALALGQRADLVVEAGQRDPALLVVQARQEAGQGVQRVGD